MMKVLLPISLDRWRNPISALLRSCVRYNPDVEFHSFSKPLSDEDIEQGAGLWQLPNLVKCRPSAMVRGGFDIVHVASYSDLNFVSSVGSKLRGCGRTRFLNTMNLEPDPLNPLAWKRYRRVLRWADGFVAVSEAVAADFRSRVPERFLGVIPNGFDPELYNPDDADESQLPPEVAKLGRGYPLWMAALEKRKHPEILVALAERNPGMVFVAVGSAIPGEGDHFAREFERVPNILWLGSVNRSTAKAVLSFAGVLVFPSEREGLSLAMIEAVGMGVPILAQPKSSMPELVASGCNGDLVEQEDIEGWNSALHHWRADRSENQVAGLRLAREGALQRFSWSTVGAAYGPVYRKVAELPRKVVYRIPA